MGRGSGGRGYSVPRTRSSAPPPAPRKQQAPASSPGTGAMASFAEGWWFSGGWALMNRAVDAVLGPRKFEVVHTAAADPSAAASSTCEIHAQAFKDCINHNASDISRCQFYIDLLNDCRRRRSQVAVVEASG